MPLSNDQLLSSVMYHEDRAHYQGFLKAHGAKECSYDRIITEYTQDVYGDALLTLTALMVELVLVRRNSKIGAASQ